MFSKPSKPFLVKRFCINFPNNIGQDIASLEIANNAIIS